MLTLLISHILIPYLVLTKNGISFKSKFYGDNTFFPEKNNQLKELIEKPKYSYLMNSGMYIFDKKLLNLMQENRYIDFDKFLKKMQTKNYKVGVFKISDRCLRSCGVFNRSGRLVG